MSSVQISDAGFRFIPGVFQYSSGVAALPGYEIIRVTMREPTPLSLGFGRIQRMLEAEGRPLTSFCACELRSPAPFTQESFRRFNEAYVKVLERWGVIRDGVNPVARSNVCPEVSPPVEPSFHAFCYTRPAPESRSTFVIAGSCEAPEDVADYREHIVRRGDTSVEGLREKARFVLRELERRMACVGATWRDTTATQVYTVHDPHSFLAQEIVQRGAARAGLTWHFNRPPLLGLEYEMDCRGLNHERAL